MTKVLFFGSYAFEDAGVDFSTNFADLVPQTMRLPGMDGGYDAYGSGAAPTEIGSIRFSLWLKAASAGEMQRKRDALRRLASMGVQRLTIEPEPGMPSRWVDCRVQNIQMAEQYAELTSKNQRVTITWQASYPRWLSTNAPAAGIVAAGVLQANVGDADTFTVRNNGSAVAIPIVTVLAETALTGGVTINLYRNLIDLTDSLFYPAAVISGHTLIFDCPALSLTDNGADAYVASFAVQHPAWLRLPPDETVTVEVYLSGVEEVSITVEFNDTWY